MSQSKKDLPADASSLSKVNDSLYRVEYWTTRLLEIGGAMRALSVLAKADVESFIFL